MSMNTSSQSQWTEILSCIICFNTFNGAQHRPISLGCGHTVCRLCLTNLQKKCCPLDQSSISCDVSELPINYALLQLVGVAIPEAVEDGSERLSVSERSHYLVARSCIEQVAAFLKPVPQGGSAPLHRSMQRKLLMLLNCQLVEEEGRVRAIRAARSVGERSVADLLQSHQNHQQVSTNLWAAIRARGCQFLGPAMQEEVLKLILLALEDGSALSRKVLVMFVLQRLQNHEPQFQASKTAVGHVVQLLYRASVFQITQRDGESSLMQLHTSFCSYEALRRAHDAEIMQVAMETGLRISPDQWSSLLYGDVAHKSQMQSIIDKVQSPQTLVQSVKELGAAIQRSNDPCGLDKRLLPHLQLLAEIDPNPGKDKKDLSSWHHLECVMRAVKQVVFAIVDYNKYRTAQRHHTGEAGSSPNKSQYNPRYKTLMCRDLQQFGRCVRGTNCSFAHCPDEMERYRMRASKTNLSVNTHGEQSPTGSNTVESSPQNSPQLVLSPHHRVTSTHSPNVPPSGNESGRDARNNSDFSRKNSVNVTTTLRLRESLMSVMSTTPSCVTSENADIPLASQETCVAQQHTIIYSSAIGRPDDVSINTQLVPNMHSKIQQHHVRSDGYGMMSTDTQQMTAAGSALSNGYHPGSEKHGDQYQIPHPPPPNVAGVYYDASDMTTNTNPYLQFPAGQALRHGGLSGPRAPQVMPASGMFMGHHALPTSDSHYYLPGNILYATRGKNPKEQLLSLQKRRMELTDQMNRSSIRQSEVRGFTQNSNYPPLPAQVLTVSELEAGIQPNLNDNPPRENLPNNLDPNWFPPMDIPPEALMNLVHPPPTSLIIHPSIQMHIPPPNYSPYIKTHPPTQPNLVSSTHSSLRDLPLPDQLPPVPIGLASIMSAPGMSAPIMSAPGMCAPGMSTPGISSRGMSASNDVHNMVAPGLIPNIAASGLSELSNQPCLGPVNMSDAVVSRISSIPNVVAASGLGNIPNMAAPDLVHLPSIAASRMSEIPNMGVSCLGDVPTIEHTRNDSSVIDPIIDPPLIDIPLVETPTELVNVPIIETPLVVAPPVVDSPGLDITLVDSTETKSEGSSELARGISVEREDEFIPFGENLPSKYGPIMRISSRTKMKNTGPVNVTSSLGQKYTNPVTAVTPLHRGYPITSPVPTAYPNGKQTSDTDDTSEHAESDQLAEQVTDCDEKLVADDRLSSMSADLATSQLSSITSELAAVQLSTLSPAELAVERLPSAAPDLRTGQHLPCEVGAEQHLPTVEGLALELQPSTAPEQGQHGQASLGLELESDQLLSNTPEVISDHVADPYGHMVASSLPTVLMSAGVLSSGTAHSSHNLWRVKEGVNATTPHSQASKTAVDSMLIDRELQTLNRRMGSLQQSEDQRLIRELDAIEMSIQETQRHVDMISQPTLPTCTISTYVAHAGVMYAPHPMEYIPQGAHNGTTRADSLPDIIDMVHVSQPGVSFAPTSMSLENPMGHPSPMHMNGQAPQQSMYDQNPYGYRYMVTPHTSLPPGSQFPLGAPVGSHDNSFLSPFDSAEETASAAVASHEDAFPIAIGSNDDPFPAQSAQMTSEQQSAFVRHLQEIEHAAVESAKNMNQQVADDQKYAESLVLEEANRIGLQDNEYGQQQFF